MLLRIGRHADFHVGMIALDARNEIGGLMIAIGMRGMRADAAGGIAAQRDDVADADIVIARDHVIDVRLDAATQVRCAAGVSLVSPRMRAMVECAHASIRPRRRSRTRNSASGARAG
jgi:hypothetical protein